MGIISKVKLQKEDIKLIPNVDFTETCTGKTTDHSKIKESILKSTFSLYN